MKKTLRFFVCLVLLCFVKQAKASHITGSEIQWKHISEWKYVITFVYYRDCRANISLQNAEFHISPSDTSIKFNSKHTAKLRSLTNVSNSCSSNTDACTPSNTPQAGRGIEKAIYTDTVDFSKGNLNSMRNMGICQFAIVFRHCCRSVEINTITDIYNGGNVGGGAYYPVFINAEMTICEPGNPTKQWVDNSPLFSIPPVLNTCCNEAVAIHTGIIEKDGDSLVFSLVPAQFGYFDTIPLKEGLNWRTQPLHVECLDSNCTCAIDPQSVKGFCFDSQTGILRFTPIFCNEIAIVVLKVEQYKRNQIGTWDYIGFIKKEWQINVGHCNNNNAPHFEEIAPLAICAGDSLCIPFDVSDLQSPYQDHLDTLEIQMFSSLSSYTLDVYPAYFDTTANDIYAIRKGKICWQTRPGDARHTPYTFSLIAYDKGCPFARIGVIQSQIKISPSIDFTIDSIEGPFVIDSSLRIFTYRVPKPFDPLSFVWTIEKGIILEGNFDAEVKVQWEDSLILETGKLYLQYVLDGDCGYVSDSLAIEFKSPIKPVLYSESVALQAGIRIYPNPTYTTLHIKSDTAMEKIQIFSLSGQLQVDQKFSSSIELSQLPAGFYFIHLKSREGNWTHLKFLKL